ncbi:ExbD/TolR family protein [Candidatus Symbiobacter mobilis]|uniref:Biopolymer transport protein ExbD n=1 Tax=Candidatus Symbiobacter mobilis CR TaxID=946483 RepID=U5N9L9_9BURK|nr:biopolymer transporter ExbD [Candidatus Symbiobacter mobilis]AGX88266.1 biopolymer transport protein ExbD [Candidatus Symbiobacter mobilis CR]
MHFRPRPLEEPEINLIPFIDVLLVILIFLMLSTTYSKFTELRIELPVADADAQRNQPREIVVGVGSEGQYSVNQVPVGSRTVPELVEALRAAGGDSSTVLVIAADAAAKHQSVVHVMEAARGAGLSHITFATQSAGR